MLADISKSADPISESWTRTLWFPSSITVVASASDIITSGEREREEEEEDGNKYIFVCNIKGLYIHTLVLYPGAPTTKKGKFVTQFHTTRKGIPSCSTRKRKGKIVWRAKDSTHRHPFFLWVWPPDTILTDTHSATQHSNSRSSSWIVTVTPDSMVMRSASSDSVENWMWNTLDKVASRMLSSMILTGTQWVVTGGLRANWATSTALR